MSDRYMWTMTGMRLQPEGFGVMRYVREIEYDKLQAEHDKLQAELDAAYAELRKQAHAATAVFDREVWNRAAKAKP